MRFLHQRRLWSLNLMMLLHLIKKLSQWDFILHNIETLNNFLKNEIAATGIYQKAFDKLRIDASQAESKSLRPIYGACKLIGVTMNKILSIQLKSAVA